MGRAKSLSNWYKSSKAWLAVSGGGGGGYDDVIINISQNFVVTLSHDVSDGVRDQLKHRRAVDPAERNSRIQEVLIIPFYPKRVPFPSSFSSETMSSMVGSLSINLLPSNESLSKKSFTDLP